MGLFLRMLRRIVYGSVAFLTMLSCVFFGYLVAFEVLFKLDKDSGVLEVKQYSTTWRTGVR